MTQNIAFNPNNHLMQLKSKEGPKDYLPVQWRLCWFREQCPGGTIDTDEMEVDLDREVTVEAFVWNAEKRRSEKVMKTAKGYARYKAIVTDGKGGRATGHGSECAADFADYVEKAETKAVGRALAMLGYGTQFAPDFDEQHRIVDSPIERTAASSTPVQNETNNASTSTNAATGNDASITDQQLSSIRNMSKHLGKDAPAGVEYLDYSTAKTLIQELSVEYKEKQRAAKQSA